MSAAVAELLAILDLEQIGENSFRGQSPQAARKRVFGGQIVAQALVAVARTVEGRAPHSLHGYFLLPGDPATPIVYEVERLRDGGSFATRRCAAIQNGRTIFTLTASFHVEEPGLDHASPMPEAPDPITTTSAVRSHLAGRAALAVSEDAKVVAAAAAPPSPAVLIASRREMPSVFAIRPSPKVRRVVPSG